MRGENPENRKWEEAFGLLFLFCALSTKRGGGGVDDVKE